MTIQDLICKLLNPKLSAEIIDSEVLVFFKSKSQKLQSDHEYRQKLIFDISKSLKELIKNATISHNLFIAIIVLDNLLKFLHDKIHTYSLEEALIVNNTISAELNFWLAMFAEFTIEGAMDETKAIYVVVVERKWRQRLENALDSGLLPSEFDIAITEKDIIHYKKTLLHKYFLYARLNCKIQNYHVSLELINAAKECAKINPDILGKTLANYYKNFVAELAPFKHEFGFPAISYIDLAGDINKDINPIEFLEYISKSFQRLEYCFMTFTVTNTAYFKKHELYRQNQAHYSNFYINNLIESCCRFALIHIYAQSKVYFSINNKSLIALNVTQYLTKIPSIAKATLNYLVNLDCSKFNNDGALEYKNLINKVSFLCYFSSILSETNIKEISSLVKHLNRIALNSELVKLNSSEHLEKIKSILSKQKNDIDCRYNECLTIISLAYKNSTQLKNSIRTTTNIQLKNSFAYYKNVGYSQKSELIPDKNTTIYNIRILKYNLERVSMEVQALITYLKEYLMVYTNLLRLQLRNVDIAEYTDFYTLHLKLLQIVNKHKPNTIIAFYAKDLNTLGVALREVINLKKKYNSENKSKPKTAKKLSQPKKHVVIFKKKPKQPAKAPILPKTNQEQSCVVTCKNNATNKVDKTKKSNSTRAYLNLQAHRKALLLTSECDAHNETPQPITPIVSNNFSEFDKLDIKPVAALLKTKQATTANLFLDKIKTYVAGDKLFLPEKIKQLLMKFAPHPFLIIGGYIRDSLLNKHIHDLDLVIVCEEKLLFDIFQDKVRRSRFKSNLFFVRTDVTNLDITVYKDLRIETITANADLTINSLLADIDGNIYDPFKKHNTLKLENIILFNRDKYLSDPIRVVRAVRIAYKTDKVITSRDYTFMLNIAKNYLPNVEFGLYYCNIGNIFLRDKESISFKSLAIKKHLNLIFPNLPVDYIDKVLEHDMYDLIEERINQIRVSKTITNKVCHVIIAILSPLILEAKGNKAVFDFVKFFRHADKFRTRDNQKLKDKLIAIKPLRPKQLCQSPQVGPKYT